MSLEVTEALCGERLDRAVALILGCTRSAAVELIARGEVAVDGVPCVVKSTRLALRSVVDLPLSADAETAEAASRVDAGVVPNADVRVDVVHEDDDFVVVHKPAGLVTLPGAGHRDDTLANGLAAVFPDMAALGGPGRAGLVHRLDRGTSGLLLGARCDDAFAALTQQLARREVRRDYFVCVFGRPPATDGRIDAPIARHATLRTRMALAADGRPAVTHYRLLDVFDAVADGRTAPVSLLHCRLETGRTHQIRVHLAGIGLSVVGDAVYGASRAAGQHRPMLHAALLRFAHPRSGQQVQASAAPPSDFCDEFAALGGHQRRLDPLVLR